MAATRRGRESRVSKLGATLCNGPQTFNHKQRNTTRTTADEISTTLALRCSPYVSRLGLRNTLGPTGCHHATAYTRMSRDSVIEFASVHECVHVCVRASACRDMRFELLDTMPNATVLNQTNSLRATRP
jgi:hypothetical protein